MTVQQVKTNQIETSTRFIVGVSGRRLQRKTLRIFVSSLVVPIFIFGLLLIDANNAFAHDLDFLEDFNQKELQAYREVLFKQVERWKKKAKKTLVYGNLSSLSIIQADKILRMSKISHNLRTKKSRLKAINSIKEAYEKLGELKAVAALRSMLISEYLSVFDRIPKIGKVAKKLLEEAADKSEEVKQNQADINALFKVKSKGSKQQKALEKAKKAINKAEELILEKISEMGLPPEPPSEILVF